MSADAWAGGSILLIEGGNCMCWTISEGACLFFFAKRVPSFLTLQGVVLVTSGSNALEKGHDEYATQAAP